MKPVDGSIDPSTLEVVIDLGRDDGVLTLGDLRRAAEMFDAHARHEVAHRLWRAVVQAAEHEDAAEIVRWANENGAASIERASSEVGERFRQSGVKFDYMRIAADRASSMTVAAVAAKNGCSTRTVARAVDFVEKRAELLEQHPGFADQLVDDSNPEVLAAFYEIDVNVMRWILAVRFDRRS